MCRSRRELSNAYLLAKIGVDTAENEPIEVWGKFNSIFIRLLNERYLWTTRAGALEALAADYAAIERIRGLDLEQLRKEHLRRPSHESSSGRSREEFSLHAELA